MWHHDGNDKQNAKGTRPSCATKATNSRVPCL